MATVTYTKVWRTEPLEEISLIEDKLSDDIFKRDADLFEDLFCKKVFEKESLIKKYAIKIGLPEKWDLPF